MARFRAVVAQGAAALALSLLAAGRVKASTSVVASASDVRTFLGDRTGRLVYIDKNDNNKVYWIDLADMSVNKLSDDQATSEPLLSSDGTRAVYGIYNIVNKWPGSSSNNEGDSYIRSLSGGSRKHVAGSSVGGRESFAPHWWVHPTSGDEHIVYMDYYEKDQQTTSGRGTWKQKIVNDLPSGNAVKILDHAFDGGLSKDGKWAAEAYHSCFMANTKDLGGGDGWAMTPKLDGGKQCCNASMSPDNSYYVMHLRLDHGGCDIRTSSDSLIRTIWKPASAGEMQNPEYSTHPGYSTFTASFGGQYYIYIANTTDGSCLEIAEGNFSSPHLWVGAAVSNVRIDSFSADPTTITSGQSSTLSWNTTNAGSVSIDQGVGPVGLDGSTSVSPTSTTTYTLTAQGAGGPVTRQATVTVSTLRDPDVPGSLFAGLGVEYYALSSPDSLPDFSSLTFYATDVAADINYPSTNGNFATSGRADNVGAVFTGYVDVPQDGVYTFYTESDDGSALYIGTTKVVDNDGLHGMQERSGSIGLRAGYHALRVDFFEAASGAGLVVSYEGPSISKQAIPPGALYFEGYGPPALTIIAVSPSSAVIAPGGPQSFTAETLDQYGDPIAVTVSWSVSGGGTLSDATGPTTTFTSDGTEDAFTVTASSGAVQGNATVTVSAAPGLHLKINCGSNAYDVTGWERDDAYVSGGEDWTNDNIVDTAGVQNAAPPGVYRSVRHRVTATSSYPSFSFPALGNRDYVVRLHFADKYTGPRHINIDIEGTRVLTDYDIASDAGGTDRAAVKWFAVTVSDGDGMQIDVLSATGEDSFICGIEIIASTDTVEPGVAITYPADSDTVGGVVTVEGTASDAGGLDRVDVKVDGGAYALATGTGNWSFSLDTTAFTDGDHTITARATDLAGNTSTDSVTVCVSNAEPSITLISPNAGEVLYVGTTRYIRWSTVKIMDVTILYWSEAGGRYEIVSPSLDAADESWMYYLWTVPDDPSANCTIHISDYERLYAPTESGPFTIRAVVDGDGDGMDDSWESSHFGDLSHGGGADDDGDGLTDLQEFQNSSDPALPDTDGDGMPDGWEVNNGTDPTTDDASFDPDGDGFPNSAEYAAGSDPRNAASTPLNVGGGGTGYSCAPGTAPATGPGAGVAFLAFLALIAWASPLRPQRQALDAARRPD